MMTAGFTSRRGIALLLVLSAVALVAILSMAMLSGASLQSSATSNTVAAVTADGLAESGLELAFYYLTNPTRSLAYDGTYWKGQTGISFGSGMPGAVDVDVLSVGADTYDITAVARTTVNGATVTRTEKCTAYATPGFIVKHGAAFDTLGILTLPAGATINSTFQVNGTLANLGIIKQTAYCGAVSQLGTLLGGWQLLTPDTTTRVPAATNVRDFRTYKYLGQTYNAVELTSPLTTRTLSPSPTNPAGVFHYSGLLDINGSITINGTLLADGLNINSGNTVITPADGFPAAVIQGSLTFKGTGTGRSLTANGLTYLHGDVKNALLGGGSLIVNGALLVDAGVTSGTFNGTINISLDANKVTGIDLDTTVPPAVVKIKSFKR